MKNKLIKLTIILTVLLVPIGLVASYNSFNGGDFQSYAGHGGGCHPGGSAYPGTPGSGSIDLTAPDGTTVVTGAIFTVRAEVTGFTEAGNDDVALGFISVEENNDKFIFSPNSDVSHSVTGGNSDAVLDFTVTAPLVPKNYTIKITAIHEQEDGGADLLYTATKTLEISVVPTPIPTSYISAANYLVNTANGSNDGYRWGYYNGSTDFYAGWNHGAAGIGDFLIEAYNKSGNSLYLNYSIGAARWLWNIRHTNGSDSYWSDEYGSDDLPKTQSNYTDVSAEIGMFFIKLYENSNYNVTYLEWAEEIAQYLKHEDQIADPNEMGWKQSDSVSYLSNSTTRVIGSFFMELQKATDNSTYRWWALNVSEYLINKADTSGIGASWKKDTQSAIEITGKWAGAAGIGDFLLDIYKKYNDNTAYEYANKTFDWLYDVSNVDQGGYVWDDEIGDGLNSTGFAVGVAGISTFLWRLANITGNNTHLAVAQGALQYLINNASGEEEKVWWNASAIDRFQFSSKAFGMAGIGEAFLFALNYTTDTIYNETVEGIYNWFVKTELRNDLNDASSTTWNATSNVGFNERYSGIYLGAAGAGFFLLRRAEYLNDTVAPDKDAYIKTAIISGASVTLNVSDAIDYESGVAGVAFYIVGPAGGVVYTNETYLITALSEAGTYTAYAIIFDAVGNPRKTNSTTFIIRATTPITRLIEEDDGSRDLWEPDYTLLYYSLIFIFIGAASIILIKMQFKRVSYRKT